MPSLRIEILSTIMLAVEQGLLHIFCFIKLNRTTVENAGKLISQPGKVTGEGLYKPRLCLALVLQVTAPRYSMIFFSFLQFYLIGRKFTNL